MWVRGLKLVTLRIGRTELVAPYVGAWIETFKTPLFFECRWVAPYVGAWIETYSLPARTPACPVAPYVGAWIETER